MLNLNVLLSTGDNAFSYKKSIVLEEARIFLRLFLTLVQQETDDSQLQYIPQFPDKQREMSK